MCIQNIYFFPPIVVALLSLENEAYAIIIWDATGRQLEPWHRSSTFFRLKSLARALDDEWNRGELIINNNWIKPPVSPNFSLKYELAISKYWSTNFSWNLKKHFHLHFMYLFIYLDSVQWSNIPLGSLFIINSVHCQLIALVTLSYTFVYRCQAIQQKG